MILLPARCELRYVCHEIEMRLTVATNDTLNLSELIYEQKSFMSCSRTQCFMYIAESETKSKMLISWNSYFNHFPFFLLSRAQCQVHMKTKCIYWPGFPFNGEMPDTTLIFRVSTKGKKLNEKLISSIYLLLGKVTYHNRKGGRSVVLMMDCIALRCFG